jgi:hypothetical protein
MFGVLRKFGLVRFWRRKPHPNPYLGRQAIQRRGRMIIEEVLPLLLYEVETSPQPLPRQASSPEERE